MKRSDRRSGISKAGNYYNNGKYKYRIILRGRPHYQADLLLFKPGTNSSMGYIWLDQDRIRRLRELLDRYRPDYLYLNGRKVNIKVEKRDGNTGVITLRDDSSTFLDYFWLTSDDVIDIIKVLNHILPPVPRNLQS